MRAVQHQNTALVRGAAAKETLRSWLRRAMSGYHVETI